MRVVLSSMLLAVGLGWAGVPVTDASAQEPEDTTAKLSYLLAQVQAREAADPVRLYGRFEVEEVGAPPPFPSGEVYGRRGAKQMRQVYHEDWWVEGEKVAVTSVGGPDVWLDGEMVSESSDDGTAEYTYMFDGTRSYTIGEKPSPVLVVNSGFPFGGSMYPILMGRADSDRRLSELLDPRTGVQVRYLRQESLDGMQNWVVEVTPEQAPSSPWTIWLAEGMGFCCTRLERHRPDGTLSYVCTSKLGRNAQGVVYPVEGRQEFFRAGKTQLKVWRTLSFSTDAPEPPHGFTPDESRFGEVKYGSLATASTR